MNNIFEMKTAWNALTSKKNNPSKNYFMLAELIDNSLGSWEENEMKSILQIKIKFNSKSKKLEILDNAYGMSFEGIANSINLNQEKEGNKFNLFGVGLKNCAFWFGRDLKIWSKEVGQKEYYTELISSKVISLTDTISWKVDESTEKSIQNFGTKVIVENIYDDKLMTDNQFSEVCIALSNKYSKYIQKNKVSINIEFTNKRGKTSEVELFSDVEVCEVIPQSKKENFIKSWEQNNEPGKFIIIKDMYDIVLNKVLNDEPINFKKTLILKRGNKDLNLEFEFGILKKKKSKKDDVAKNDVKDFKSHYGVTTFQNDRAINFAPSNPMDFSKKFDYTRTNIKRLFAKIELGNYFKPDNNKTQFNFQGMKEDFDELLNNIAIDFMVLIETIVGIIPASKQKVGNTAESADSLGRKLSTKTSDNVKFTISETGSEVVSKNFDIDGDIKIEIVEINDLNFFIEAENVDGNKNNIKITYSISHPIWAPIINFSTKSDIKTVIYPLLVVFALSQIKYEGLKNINTIGINGSDSITESVESKIKNDYVNMINKVVNYIFEDEK